MKRICCNFVVPADNSKNSVRQLLQNCDMINIDQEVNLNQVSNQVFVKADQAEMVSLLQTLCLDIFILFSMIRRVPFI